LSLRVAPQRIDLDLSREFIQGGGSDSMVGRVAQVLYTATSLDPTAKVYLSVEGQRLDENHPLGGEGVILQQPLTRQQFAVDFKDILHQ
jgi:spore germination protein GerM